MNYDSHLSLPPKIHNVIWIDGEEWVIMRGQELEERQTKGFLSSLRHLWDTGGKFQDGGRVFTTDSQDTYKKHI